MPSTTNLTARELRELASAPDRLLDMAEQMDARDAACTSVAALWCPVHGQCACPEPEDSRSDPSCPLHATTSDHAD